MTKKKDGKKKLVLRTKVTRDEDEVEDEDAPAEEEDASPDDVEDEEDEEETPTPATTPPPPPTTTPAPVPAKPKPAPKPKPALKPASAAKEPWEDQLLDRLQFIHDYHEVTVPQFRAFTDLGADARQVLDSYLAQELVEERWHNAAGRYSLTEKGEARRVELGGAEAEEPEKETEEV